MKKIAIFSTITLTLLTIAYNQIGKKRNPSLQKNVKFADARLAYNRIEKDLDNKIKFIKENITQNGAYPNKKELLSLIESIKTIRSYGKDLSKASKNSLKVIVKSLKSKHNNIDLVKKLETFIATSQQLVA